MHKELVAAAVSGLVKNLLVEVSYCCFSISMEQDEGVDSFYFKITLIWYYTVVLHNSVVS